MKNFAKLFGIIALCAIIGFGVTACDDGGGGGGENLTLKIRSASGETITKVEVQEGGFPVFEKTVSIAPGSGDVDVKGSISGERGYRVVVWAGTKYGESNATLAPGKTYLVSVSDSTSPTSGGLSVIVEED